MEVGEEISHAIAIMPDDANVPDELGPGQRVFDVACGAGVLACNDSFDTVVSQ
jgi:hypothetical protein